MARSAIMEIKRAFCLDLLMHTSSGIGPIHLNAIAADQSIAVTDDPCVWGLLIAAFGMRWVTHLL